MVEVGQPVCRTHQRQAMAAGCPGKAHAVARGEQMGGSVHRFGPGANPCAIVAEGKVPGAFSDLPGKSMQKDGGGLLGQFPPPPSTGAASAFSCSSVWKRGSSRIGSQDRKSTRLNSSH